MPDLSADEIARWLHAREPSIAAEIASSLPPAEEDDIVLPAVIRFGAVLDVAFGRSPDRLKHRLQLDRVRAATRTVLAHMGRGRRLRLLHWFAEIPGLEHLPASLLTDEGTEADAFLRAEIRALHRRTSLSRIFGQDRIAALLAACTEAAQSEIQA
jgi:hypothetical protein